MVMSRMNRSGIRLVAGLASTALIGVGLTAPAFAGNGHGYGHGHGQRAKLSTTLTGANERPTTGDPDGRGTARVKLTRTQVCFTLSWRNIQAPTAAHIHEGSRNEAGPVVVGLFSVPGGIGAPINSVSGCTDADPALIREIRRDPQDYYVNIHNTTYPGGAIRGQLR